MDDRRKKEFVLVEEYEVRLQQCKEYKEKIMKVIYSIDKIRLVQMVHILRIWVNVVLVLNFNLPFDYFIIIFSYV